MDVIQVPYYAQTPGSQECWFACTLMVLAYFNKLKGEQSYQELKLRYGQMETTDPEKGEGKVKLDKLFRVGGNEAIICQLLQDSEIPAAILYKKNPKIDFHGIIADKIKEKKPVIMGLNIGSRGHFVTVVGVDKDKNRYVVQDPLKAGTIYLSFTAGNIATAVVMQ